uniref:Uncharacterized protein n=1 Tax=Chromera velia CCMP2878 TaxID=1169474 RepID=A0A0G4G9F1_9ALVE|eukprot:Cvel_20779.t1-p1 / transcript=Cvel_20779.t1 / gene=Cvel_20779 / organism=Chromera_velia_CCMP2878 / gene_product=hypothetical protein / transcript_product=hypothetical protein / location=Cvel_scaffold1896:17670-19105(+) / protein_length=282 / sequence_SO=supercontig / SO=protein_coding / is_pseudo=false
MVSSDYLSSLADAFKGGKIGPESLNLSALGISESTAIYVFVGFSCVFLASLIVLISVLSSNNASRAKKDLEQEDEEEEEDEEKPLIHDDRRASQASSAGGIRTRQGSVKLPGEETVAAPAVGGQSPSRSATREGLRVSMGPNQIIESGAPAAVMAAQQQVPSPTGRLSVSRPSIGSLTPAGQRMSVASPPSPSMIPAGNPPYVPVGYPQPVFAQGRVSPTPHSYSPVLAASQPHQAAVQRSSTQRYSFQVPSQQYNDSRPGSVVASPPRYSYSQYGLQQPPQ